MGQKSYAFSLCETCMKNPLQNANFELHIDFPRSNGKEYYCTVCKSGCPASSEHVSWAYDILAESYTQPVFDFDLTSAIASKCIEYSLAERSQNNWQEEFDELRREVDEEEKNLQNAGWHQNERDGILTESIPQSLEKLYCKLSLAGARTEYFRLTFIIVEEELVYLDWKILPAAYRPL